MDELRLLLLSLGGVFVVGLAAWEFRRSRASRGGGSADEAAAAAGGRRNGRQEPSFDASSDTDLSAPFDLPDIRTSDVSRDPPLVVLGEGRAPRSSVAIGISGEVAVDRPGHHPPQSDAGHDIGTSSGSGFDDDEDSTSTDGRYAHATAAVPALDDAPVDDSLAADAVADDGVEEGVIGAARIAGDGATRPAVEPAPIHWPPERQDRILSLRVVPPSGERFGGRSLRLALTSHGLVHGPQDIFHLPVDDGRVILSAAGLTRPGTFDPATMDGQFFLGLHLFSVLPGPLPASRMLDELVTMGRDLAARLGGQLLDDVGRPFDAARLDVLQRSLATPAPGGARG